MYQQKINQLENSQYDGARQNEKLEAWEKKTLLYIKVFSSSELPPKKKHRDTSLGVLPLRTLQPSGEITSYFMTTYSFNGTWYPVLEFDISKFQYLQNIYKDQFIGCSTYKYSRVRNVWLLSTVIINRTLYVYISAWRSIGFQYIKYPNHFPSLFLNIKSFSTLKETQAAVEFVMCYWILWLDLVFSN